MLKIFFPAFSAFTFMPRKYFKLSIFSLAGKRLPRTESGLVEGNCAVRVGVKTKRVEELEKSGGMKVQKTKAWTWTGAAKMANEDFSHF